MKKNNKSWILFLTAILVCGLFTLTGASAASAAAEAAAASSETKNGWKTESGYKYYYINGKKQTGLKTIKKKLYYFDSKGRLTVSRHGIKIGKNYYAINAKGVATKVTEVEGLAGIRVDKLAGKTTNKNTLLKKAFNWSRELKYRSVKETKKNAAAYYGTYGFKNNCGDCYVQAAAFYWMAKSIGFTNMSFVQGTVPSTKGVNQPHGWVERKVGKKYYFFDPNAAGDKKAKVTYNFLYGTPGSLHYNDSHNHRVQYTE